MNSQLSEAIKIIDVSVVVPTFRSAHHIKRSLDAILESLRRLEREFELIVVDDGSDDQTWENLTLWVRSNGGTFNLKAVQLRTNVGQQTATLCGMRCSSGRFVVTIDDDLQNNPSDIEKLLAALEANDVDVVLGVSDSQNKSGFRKLGTRLVDRVVTRLFMKPQAIKLSPFRAIRREVVEEICRTRNNLPYLTAEILLLSRRMMNVPVSPHAESRSRSTYKTRGLLTLFRRIVVAYSTRPLKWTARFSAAASLLSMVLALSIVGVYAVGGSSPPGWTSLMVLLSLFSFQIMIVIAVIVEYLALLVDRSLQPSQYAIRQRIGTRDFTSTEWWGNEHSEILYSS